MEGVIRRRRCGSSPRGGTCVLGSEALLQAAKRRTPPNLSAHVAGWHRGGCCAQRSASSVVTKSAFSCSRKSTKRRSAAAGRRSWVPSPRRTVTYSSTALRSVLIGHLRLLATVRRRRAVSRSPLSRRLQWYQVIGVEEPGRSPTWTHLDGSLWLPSCSGRDGRRGLMDGVRPERVRGARLHQRRFGSLARHVVPSCAGRPGVKDSAHGPCEGIAPALRRHR